jgi:hypothetical protein
MIIDYAFNFGMAFGIMFATAEELEEQEISFGMVLLLGPISIFIEKV